MSPILILRPARNKGLSLMEVLVALAVLSIALIAVLKAMLQIEDNLIQGQKITEQSLLAFDKLAEVKAKGLEEWRDYYGEFPEHPELGWEVDISEAEADFLSKVKVTLFDARSKKELKSIEELVFVPRKP